MITQLTDRITILQKYKIQLSFGSRQSISFKDKYDNQLRSATCKLRKYRICSHSLEGEADEQASEVHGVELRKLRTNH
jgi:hypothetical protein